MNLIYKLLYQLQLLVHFLIVIFFLESCSNSITLPLEEQKNITQASNRDIAGKNCLPREENTFESQVRNEEGLSINFSVDYASTILSESHIPLDEISATIRNDSTENYLEKYKRKFEKKNQTECTEVKRRKVFRGDTLKEKTEVTEQPSEYLLEYQCLLNTAVKGDIKNQFKLGKRAYKIWQEQVGIDAAQEAKIWLRRAAGQNYQPSIILLKKLEDESLYRQEDMYQRSLPELPTEIWAHILSYVKYPEILSARIVNHLFYELITGSTKLGLVGVNNNPRPIISLGNWTIDKYIDFKDKELNKFIPESVPSFFFYHLIGKGKNLPQAFWPYLKGTKIHTINLSGNRLEATEAIEFVKNLTGSNIHTVILNGNNLRDLGAVESAKYLQGTKVEIIELDCNQIGDIGIIGLAQNLQRTNVCTISLGNNTKIGTEGITKFAKNLKGTKIRQVRLLRSKIDKKTRKLLKEQYSDIDWIF